MILEIRLSNFFSIKEEITLDLRAGTMKNKPTQELSDNTFMMNEETLLKSVFIYGANASGKSNIIKAIQYCCRFILESGNHHEQSIFNFSPFKFHEDKNAVSTFFIQFICKGIKYEYSFSLTKESIVEEKLDYYPNGRKANIFDRDERRGEDKNAKYSFQKVIKRPFDVVVNTSHKTLYLSRASQMDRSIAEEIYQWFNETFLLDYLPINDEKIIYFLEEKKELLLNALKLADSDIVDIGLKEEMVSRVAIRFELSGKVLPVQEKNEEKQLKIVTYHQSAPEIPFDFFREESLGTQKLLYVLMTIFGVIEKGGVLLIDEIEMHFHSHIVEFIVNLFKQSKTSQLICTTHNTHLLNLKKLRKDQIYFVNKKGDGSSDLYSLYDYKDFRENMDLEKAYLEGRFDAIPYIDFSSLQ